MSIGEGLGMKPVSKKNAMPCQSLSMRHPLSENTTYTFGLEIEFLDTLQQRCFPLLRTLKPARVIRNVRSGLSALACAQRGVVEPIQR